MDQFIQQAEPLLLTLAPVVLPILFTFLYTAAKSALDKLPSKQRETLANIVNTGVAAAEQTGLGKLTGDQKKQFALDAIHAQLAHFGLSVPDSVIVPMLEEAVLFLNLARGKNPAAIKATLPSIGSKG